MSTDKDFSITKDIEQEIQTVWEIFRHNLRLLRHSEGLSADELGQRCRMQPKRIADLEGGRMHPNLNDLIKLVEYFPITYDDLLDYKIGLKIKNGGQP